MTNMVKKEFEDLYKEIVSCTKCSRLVQYRKAVAGTNPRYKNQKYWSKPLTGFGDLNARIVIIGLAPAAHGGNRTGRMFTGDESGNNLMKALYNVGLANQEYSIDKNDGLKLKDVYITAVVRCPPPKNLPTREEIHNCLHYLTRELALLRNARVYVALGRIAWEYGQKALERLGISVSQKKEEFKHGKIVNYKNNGKKYYFIASYHPSPRNVRTGLLKIEELSKIFSMAKKLAEGEYFFNEVGNES